MNIKLKFIIIKWIMHFIFALVRIENETEKENESSLLHCFSTYRNKLIYL